MVSILDDVLRVFVGFDPREAVAYHVFTQSVLEHASQPVSFTPLTTKALGNFQRDGTNAFTFSRYLVPYLSDFSGWAIFCDGDMVVTRDIAELWEERSHFSFNKAVALVKHDYRTKHPKKYIGSNMESANFDYPRKNWSSVMLWNCGHAANRVLTHEYIRDKPGDFLHRFGWLKDEQIGDLWGGWNYLVGEQPPSSSSLYHYTLGVPGFKHYVDDHASWHWHTTLVKALKCGNEIPSAMVERAEERVGTDMKP